MLQYFLLIGTLKSSDIYLNLLFLIGILPYKSIDRDIWSLIKSIFNTTYLNERRIYSKNKIK